MPKMSPHDAPGAPASAHSPLAYNLAGITVLVLLVAIGAAYLLDAMGERRNGVSPDLAETERVIQTLSGRELSIPPSLFRHGEQIREGFTNQIDLRVDFSGEDGAVLPVDITLMPRSGARTSASLLDRVYLHQFTEDVLGGIPGLVGKPLKSGEGYEGESVWYDALSANPFAAKCMAPVAEGLGAQCVRTVYLPSGIAAIYTFDATILQSWRRFDAEMERWLAPIGAW